MEYPKNINDFIYSIKHTDGFKDNVYDLTLSLFNGIIGNNDYKINDITLLKLLTALNAVILDKDILYFYYKTFNKIIIENNNKNTIKIWINTLSDITIEKEFISDDIIMPYTTLFDDDYEILGVCLDYIVKMDEYYISYSEVRFIHKIINKYLDEGKYSLKLFTQATYIYKGYKKLLNILPKDYYTDREKMLTNRLRDVSRIAFMYFYKDIK